MDDYVARPGVGKLRELLARRPFRLTDSELEGRFLPYEAAYVRETLRAVATRLEEGWMD